MIKRTLGQNGPQVSILGFGAMSIAGFYGPMTNTASMQILDACVDLGITHIDTANVYGMGHSETVIGNWLKKRGGNNPFTIATKVGITANVEQRLNNDPSHMQQALDASLQRLGVEAIDLYYVHRRDIRFEIEAVTETMAGFVKAGKVKAIGFSEISPSSLRRAHTIHPITAVQSEYSLSTRAAELGLLQTCAELGTSFVAFSPLGRALLTDTPHTIETIKDLDWLRKNPRFTQPNLDYNLAYNACFCQLAQDMGVAAASLAIAWLIHQGEHILPIPGTRSIQHLQEAVAGTEIKLTKEDQMRIEKVLPVGWAHGDRYSTQQWVGPERYC